MINRTLRFSRILIAGSALALSASVVNASDGISKAEKYFAKAAQYEMQGDLEKAAKYRAKAEQYSGENDAYQSKADKYFAKAAHYEAQGDFEKAAKYRAKAEQYSGESESYQTKAEKYAAKAARYAASGDSEKAAKYAAKALKYANEEGNSKAAKYAEKAEQKALEGDLEKASYYAAKAEKYAKKYNDSCWPVVAADFDSDGVHATVESSKDLSNVVMLFSDGSIQRLDNLEGHDLLIAGSGVHAGKVLTGVWIKSGCNHSGDGPGYGEFVESSDSVTGLPVISISGLPRNFELNDGDISEAIFTVSLSEMVPLDGESVSVTLLTSDGSAEAGTDYVPEETTLTFEPGELSLQYSILIIGDNNIETQEENYFVELANPHNAILGESLAMGWIFDDDDTDF